jgi:CRP-like cAMP-binding protein
MRLEPRRANPTLGDQALGLRCVSPSTLTWSSTKLPAGQVLYREGSVPDRLFDLESGIVKELAHSPDGRARIVGLHGPGAILGIESSATAPSVHRYTAIAVTPVAARSTSTAELRRLRHSRPDEYLELMERHCERLQHAKRWITEFYADITTSRIARAIRYLAELQQLPGPNVVELLTCQEMAEVVGVSTESASRVLARFKRIGVLTPVSTEPASRHYHLDPVAVDAFANN